MMEKFANEGIETQPFDTDFSTNMYPPESLEFPEIGLSVREPFTI